MTSPCAVAIHKRSVIAADGTFYSTDGFIIRKTTVAGVSTILAGSPYDPTDGPNSMKRFMGIALNSQESIYVIDSPFANGGSAIRKVSSDGVVTTIAGSLTEKGALDGSGGETRLGNLNSIVVDSAGNILVADCSNHAIRKITPNGVVTTVVRKLGQSGYSVGALPGLLNSPGGLAITSSDELYVVVATMANGQPTVEILKINL